MVMKAGKAVYRQMKRIVKALLGLSADKDPKTYSESRTLLTAICDSRSRAENVREFSSCARIRLLDHCFRNAGDNARE